MFGSGGEGKSKGKKRELGGQEGGNGRLLVRQKVQQVVLLLAVVFGVGADLS